MNLRNGLIIASMAVVFAPLAAQAQNRIVFSGAGSSAMWNVFRTAALTDVNGTQGQNAWQARSNQAFVDNSTGTPIRDTGPLWVVWGGSANNRRIYFYLSTDSGNGVRAFYNRATLDPDPTATKDSGFADLPADVAATIEGALISVGMTDVGAADVKVTFQNAFRLGYSSQRPLQGYNGSGTLENRFLLDFDITARNANTLFVGAAPVVVFANKTLTGAGDLGAPEFDNINRFPLALLHTGALRRTRNIIPSNNQSLPDKPVIVFQREIGSGTYITFEENALKSVNLSQEDGALSQGSGENPLNETTPAWTKSGTSYTRGGRVRGIGTRGITQNVNTTPNAIGYTFWSTGNAGEAPNAKYLQVEGVDPLLDSYIDGTWPTGSQVTFKNIRNGSYPIWAILRGFFDPGFDSAELRQLFSTATNTDNGGNFVPLQNLQVFRSHSQTIDVRNPSNGNVSGRIPNGADTGGAVFPISADQDFFADTGRELINLRLGQQPNRLIGSPRP